MVTIDGYILDATLTETPSYTAEATDHPVEVGADVSDNIRAKPLIYTIEAVVSDTPIGVVAQDPTRASWRTTPPSKDAHQRLVAIQQGKKLVTIVSDRFGKMINMALLTLSPPVTKDTGRSYQFTATFKQITFVNNNRTTIRVAVPSNAPKKQLGNRPTTTAPNAPGPRTFVRAVKQTEGAITDWQSALITVATWADPTKSPMLPVAYYCYDASRVDPSHPDGYLDKNDHGGYDLTLFVIPPGSGGLRLNPTVNGTPVRWNAADNTWRTVGDDNVAKTVPQGTSKWDGVVTDKGFGNRSEG